MRWRQRQDQAATLQWLEAIANRSTDAIFAKDAAGRYLLLNRGAAAMAGKSAAEILSQDDTALFPPDQAARVMAEDRQLLADGRLVTLEQELSLPDGAHTFLTTKGPLRDADGTVFGLFGIARDITEYQRAEQAGRDSLTRLNEAQRAAHIGSWESDRVHHRVWWSEELYRLFEMDPAQASPPSREEFWGQLIHPDDRAVTRAAYDEAIAHHTRFCVHGRLLFADGRLKHIEMMGSAEYAADGAVERTHGTIQDITERKQAEQAIQALNAGLEQRVIERTAALATEIAQRQQVEEQLREREDLLRLFIDRAPAALAMFDRDMRYLAVSQRWLDDYALGERNILGLSHYEVFPEIPERWKAVHQRALAGETIRADEDPFERADGRRQWLRWEVLPWRKRDEAVGGIVIFSEDITARRQAEEETRQFRTITDKATYGAALTGLDGHLTYVNETFARMHGWEPADLLGCHLSVFHSEEQIPRVEELLARLVREGEFSTEEVWHQKRDGSVFPTLMNASLIRDAAGNPRFLSTTALDITERKQAEERLRRSEERLRLATDGAELGTWYWDMATGILEWSDRCKRHLGLPPGKEPSFEHFYAVMHPDDRDRVAHLLEQARENRSDYMADYRVTWPDGSPHWISAPGRVYGAANGDLIGMGGVTLDITARKQAEAEQDQLRAQLAQAQKLESIGRLAGGVAHDFNNMLGAILGHVELALEQVDAAQPLHADLKAIQQGAERAADLTRQLLAFARKQVIVPKVLDLNDTVAGSLQMLRRLIGEDIHLAWTPGAELWAVKLDPSQIDQILVNLVVNARQAIAGVGTIAIETANATFDEVYCSNHAGFILGDYVRLSVSDDGCGMDPEMLAHLFEPFFTTKAVGQGTGLGLATLYGVVKQNQGFINVYSEPGQGTSFKIYLPRHRDEVAPVPIVVPAAPVRRGHETVLLVEDEPTLLNLVRLMLEKLGYRVLAAGTPGEAVRWAKQHAGEIHVLVTDVVMPEMNGRDLAQRLVSLHPNLKCLFMSGYTANVIAPHGVLEEGVPFIQKPFSMKELASKIRQTLEREPAREGPPGSAITGA